MTYVPWIPLSTSWPRHRKTMALRRLIGTAEPIIGLWCWAAENAPDGDLSNFSPEDIEIVSGWVGERGKAFSAMVEVGFIDKVSDPCGDNVSHYVSANRYVLHEWMDEAGAKVASYLSRRDKQRNLMRRRRSGSDPESDPRREEDQSKSVVPMLALTRDADREARNVLKRFSAIRAEICATTALFFQPPETAVEKTKTWLLGMEPGAEAEIEPVIRLACEHVKAGHDGWQNHRDPNYLWGTIVSRWTALREELRGGEPEQRKGRPEVGVSKRILEKYGVTLGGKS